MSVSDTLTGVSRSDADGVATITLERPPANLLTPDLMESFSAALLSADADDAVRAIIVTGAGEVFCGGLDGERIKAGGKPIEFGSALVRLLKIFPTLGTPVIAAVNGDAVASGFSLVCSADIAVSVPEARLGTIESSMGLWPMVAQVPVLQRLLPRHAMQNIMTGEPFSPADALRVGALNEVVSKPSELRPAALRWAQLASRSGKVTAAGRRSFYRQVQLPLDAALDDALGELTAMLG